MGVGAFELEGICAWGGYRGERRRLKLRSLETGRIENFKLGFGFQVGHSAAPLF